MKYGIVAPCFGCQDRKVNCHSKCEKYKEFKSKNDKAREESHKRLEGEMCFWENYFKGR